MIRAYPNPADIPGEPFYVGQADGLTVEQWLVKNMPGYEPRESHPIVITINGYPIAPQAWPHTWLHADQQVEIRPSPKGIEYIIGAVVALVVAAAAYIFRPSVPTTTNQQNSTSGTKLLEASASANQVKLNDVIPEIAGRVRRYPDYLVAPHRQFANDNTTQTMQMILSVGWGEFEILPDDILIGDTPFNSLGAAIEYQVYAPGEDMSDNPDRLNWYNAPEVGPAVGASGIPLRSSQDADTSWDGSLTYLGDDITSAPANLPEGWAIGLVVNIVLPQNVTIIDGGGTAYDQIVGGFRWLGLRPGDTFTINRYPEDTFRVNTLTAGSGNDEDVLTMDVWTFSPSGSFWEPVSVLDPGQDNWTFRNTDDIDFVIIDSLPNGFTFTGRRNGSVIAGWPGFPTVNTSGSQVTADTGIDQGLWSTPFAACPKGETTNNVEWDVFAPQGLVETGETSGNLYQISRTVQIRYREVGATAWEGIISHTISGRSLDQLGWSFREVLPRFMRPEIQVRRTDAGSTSVYIRDDLEFYGLRSLLTTPASYEGITVLALTLRGSDQIAAQTDNQINVICTRKLPIMEGPGQWGPAQPTRALSSWIRYIALSAGYTDADIDQDELWRLHQVWTARGDTFDFIEADDSTVKEVLARVMRVGFAELTISEGRIKPARDEPRSAIQNVYSAQNMTQELKYTVTMPREDDPDGVDVEYVDSESWTSETVPCRLPGDTGFHPEQIKAEGILDRDKAYQLGMRHRSILKYRRKGYAFATEMDALNSEYLNYDAIISDVPGQGQSMMLIANQGATLHVSEALDWSAGGDHMVAWRRPDGSLAGPYPASMGEDDYSVVMGGSPEIPVMDQNLEPPHVFFGPKASWRHEVLIMDIQPQGFETVNVVGEGYDERVYAYDDAPAPPATNPVGTAGQSSP